MPGGGLDSARGGRQQRQEGEQRDDRQVLEQQHAERGLAHGALSQALLLQVLQHDGRGRQRQDQAHGQRHAPVGAQDQGDGAYNSGARQHLRGAQTEDRRAHFPQQRRPHLQSDQEQQDHHAELGEGHHVGLVAHKGQREGAHQHAGDQVAEDGTQPQALGDGNGDDAGRQIDQGLDEEGVCGHAGITIP